MASIKKYSDKEVVFEMRHNTREHKKPPSNIDIDPERTPLNFSLAPDDRGGALPDGGVAADAARAYHRARLAEVYHYNRADLVTACQWVITAPKDLPPEERDAFWSETMAFLHHTYGEENCIQAIVHRDEGVEMNGEIVEGENHLHYMFIPVVRNKNYMVPTKTGSIPKARQYEYKVCADELITKKHLLEWHPAYQKWLDEHGIHCTVHSGVTGGRNRTVDELKRETLDRELVKSQEREAHLAEAYEELRDRMEAIIQDKSQELDKAREAVAELTAEKQNLQDRLAAVERERDQAREQAREREHDRDTSINPGWGDTSGWGEKGHDYEWGTKTQ